MLIGTVFAKLGVGNNKEKFVTYVLGYLYILVCASSHTRVHVRERDRERTCARVAHKATPSIFLCKYLLVDPVDIAEMFG